METLLDEAVAINDILGVIGGDFKQVSNSNIYKMVRVVDDAMVDNVDYVGNVIVLLHFTIREREIVVVKVLTEVLSDILLDTVVVVNV